MACSGRTSSSSWGLGEDLSDRRDHNHKIPQPSDCLSTTRPGTRDQVSLPLTSPTEVPATQTDQATRRCADRRTLQICALNSHSLRTRTSEDPGEEIHRRRGVGSAIVMGSKAVRLSVTDKLTLKGPCLVGDHPTTQKVFPWPVGLPIWFASLT